jgi:polyisoprenoid-binding protein YceI
MKSLRNTSLIFASIFLFAACGGNTEDAAGTDEAAEQTENTADAGEKPSGTYTLSPEESKLIWAGSMLKVGGVSLYGHEGTINVQKGMIDVKEGEITGGTIVVDMQTITPTDDQYNPEEGSTKEKLVGHLSSDDFFAVEEYPTATFEITGMQDNKIMGNMTIRGETHEEIIEDVKTSMEGGKMKAKGTMVIDRQKYNVAFKMPAEDKILSDDIELKFEIMASDGGTM